MKMVEGRNLYSKLWNGLLWLHLGVLPQICFAIEAGAPLSEDDYLQEIPIVLSASRLQQPLTDSPVAVTIIDHEMIKASGAREIADLFRLVPGFQVAWERGSRAVVTNHGMSDAFSRRMQILVDGRAAYQTTLGGASWSDLPILLDDIERIEVIRGPNAVSYGSNAFMGTINIITNQASASEGVFTRATMGTDNIADAVIRVSQSDGGLDYRLSMGYQQDDGLSMDPNNPNDTFDYKRIPVAALNMDYQATTKDSFSFRSGYSGADRGDRFSNFTYQRDVTRYFAQISWQHTPAADEELILQFFNNYVEMDDAVDITAPITSTLDRSYSGERYDMELQHILKPSVSTRLVWGAGVRRDSVYAPFHFQQTGDRETDSERVFANLEVQINNATLANIGAMIEHFNPYGTNISPRAAVSYHLSEQHVVRATISQAYRAPLAFEQYTEVGFYLGDYVVNYDFFAQSGLNFAPGTQDALEPEEITSFELGYNGRYLDQMITLDLRVYRDKLKDIITPFPILPVGYVPGTPVTSYGVRFGNLDTATINGFEAQIAHTPNRWSRVNVTYAYIDIGSSDATTIYSDIYAYSQSTPRHSISILASRQWQAGFSNSLIYTWVDDMRWLGIGDYISSHDRLDLRMAAPLKMNGTQGEVALVIQNILDDYAEFRNENIFETRAFVTASLEFL
jgi:iron complex outermembrane receptor protein